MKPLTLLLCLFLLGCEKRVADPELEQVRAWVVSEVGEKALANKLASDGKVTLNQLEPTKHWTIKRISGDLYTPGYEFSCVENEPKESIPKRWHFFFSDARLKELGFSKN
ncbi:MAG: hypothetical protein AAF514_18985 [Verrucomicrobiota bacterium]